MKNNKEQKKNPRQARNRKSTRRANENDSKSSDCCRKDDDLYSCSRSPSTSSSSESESASDSKKSKRKRHHKHRHHSSKSKKIQKRIQTSSSSLLTNTMLPTISCTYLFVVVLLLFSSSHATRAPLTGDDWIITDHRSYVAHGHVPGTIHTILLAANQIPEPYWGYNDVDLRGLVYSSWTFRKEFSLSQDFLTFAQFALHFDQIDTVANITLNDCFLGQTNSMFIPYTFDVTPACLKPDNVLQIDFESPILHALHQAKVYNETVVPECPPDVQHGECHVNFIRKEPCSFSWDWGPAFCSHWYSR